MSSRMSLFVLMITLVVGIEGHHSEKRTFWSKRNLPVYSQNYGLEDGNNSAMPRKFKRSNIKVKLKGFPVLPFSTMIRKPLGKKRASPSFHLNLSFSDIFGPQLIRHIRNEESLRNRFDNTMDNPFFRINRK